METRRRVMVIFGTRPEAIKLAPVLAIPLRFSVEVHRSSAPPLRRYKQR